MKIEKNELAKKIGQLKSIVPTRNCIDALKGVLYKNGYLIASDTELTVKAKLEGIQEGLVATQPFIIPSKAFELIRSLPDGELELDASGDSVTIKQGKIKNTFKTLPAAKFAYNRGSMSGDSTATLSADKFRSAVSHVLYAVGVAGANKLMMGVFMSCEGGKLDFVGLDGHRIAWDSLSYDGKFSMIIPKSALENLMKMDIEGDIAIYHDDKGALFKTEAYEIYTRLIDGEYFKYQNMFQTGPIGAIIDRRVFADAINRARLCGSDEDKAPVIFELDEDVIHISYRNSTADYKEDVPTISPCTGQLKIAFAPRLMTESLKSFECDNVTMDFTSAKMPVVIKAEDSDMTALVLPVSFKE